MDTDDLSAMAYAIIKKAATVSDTLKAELGAISIRYSDNENPGHSPHFPYTRSYGVQVSSIFPVKKDRLLWIRASINAWEQNRDSSPRQSPSQKPDGCNSINRLSKNEKETLLR